MKTIAIVLSFFIITIYPSTLPAGFDFKKVKNSIKKRVDSVSESEVIDGLKEALSLGADKASDKLSSVDGYFKTPEVKIPFPEKVSYVADHLKKLGFSKQVDDFELTLNRAAESAAKEAKPIFLNAIKEMSFDDARKILTGGDTEATFYLANKTSDELTSKFSPVIQEKLDQVGATKHWTTLATAYNKIPFTKNKAETDLVKYTTDKSLKGLFFMIGEEEKKIRQDPAARVTDLLKKVFDKS